MRTAAICRQCPQCGEIRRPLGLPPYRYCRHSHLADLTAQAVGEAYPQLPLPVACRHWRLQMDGYAGWGWGKCWRRLRLLLDMLLIRLAGMFRHLRNRSGR